MSTVVRVAFVLRSLLNGSSVLMGLGALTLSASAQAFDVGTTAGQFAVSPSGSATYDIPITVPPGVAGMQPSLSISYDSNSRNGLLGIGFALGGLSQITRCPTTLEQDGFIDPVDFDNNDGLCLDGQRLNLKFGTYLGTAEYQTEIESFSRIISYAGASNDPAYFRVFTKDGLEMLYGQVANARFDMAGSSKALVWAVNRIADTAGNSIVITWAEASDSLGGVPQRIDYAFSTSGQAAASVTFNYALRTDGSVAYVGGLPAKSTQLLSSIVTYSFTTPVRTYTLGYEYDGSVGQARMKTVQECAGPEHCLPVTEFQWSVPTSYSSYIALNGPPHHVRFFPEQIAIDLSRLQFGDFNGDGRTDSHVITDLDSSGDPAQIGLGSSTGTFSLTTGASFSVRSNLAESNVDVARARVVDMNADGLSDIYYIDGWSATGTTPAKVLINQGNGSFTQLGGPAHSVYSDPEKGARDVSRVRLADFNGDSRLDVYVVNGLGGNASASIFFFDGDSFSSSVAGPVHSIRSSEQESTVDVSRVKHGDFNGDGKTDIYVVEGWGQPATSTIHLSHGPGGLFTTVTGVTPSHMVSDSYERASIDLSRVQIADFNGDSLSDVLVINGWGGSAPSEIYLSKGNGTFQVRTGPTFTLGDTAAAASADMARIQLADLNGDGAADIFEVNRTSGASSNVWLSRFGNEGATFTQAQGPSLPIFLGSYYSFTNMVLNVATGTGRRVNVGDFTGDGTAELYVVTALDGDTQPASVYYFEPGGDRITRVINGLGAHVVVNYMPLTQEVVHTRSVGAVYPIAEAPSTTHVVSDHYASSGVNSPMRHVRHRYWGSRQHLRGRGWLGFSKVTTEDTTSSQRDTRQYRQDFPFIGMPHDIRHETSSSVPISWTQTTYATRAIGPTVFPYSSNIVIRDYDVGNGVLNRTTVTTNTYGDDYGNLTDSLTSVHAGGLGAEAYTTHVVNTYDNDTTNWRLGRLTRTEVTRTRPQAITSQNVALSGTRVSTFEYDPATGLLSAEIVEPGSPFELRKQYARYRGNITATTISGPDITARTVTTDFNQAYPYYGRFPTTATNALGHVTTSTFDPATGNVITVRDPNNLLTTLSYDAFGRGTGDSFNNYGVSRSTTVERLWCSQVSVCGAGDSHVMRTTSSTAAESFVVYDTLERQTRSLVKDPNGSFVQALTEYDNLGRVARKSNPHFTNVSQVYWTDYEYDSVGRLKKETAPGTRVTQFTYSGLITTQTDPRNNQTMQQSDVLGNVVTVRDAKGGWVQRTYDAFDNMVISSDPGGAYTVIAYDTRGRKVAMQDPNMGPWVYKYNALGELTEQRDAKGQVVYMTYDLLGRMIERVEQEGITTWTYDTVRKGALASVEGVGYRRGYTYFPWGGVARETISIASAPPPPDAGCPMPLLLCGGLPPGEIPEDPVGTVVAFLCGQYPGICEQPDLPVDDIQDLISGLCAQYPHVCDPDVPPAPTDPVGTALALVCGAAPAVCGPVPPPPPELPLEQIEQLVGALCVTLPDICNPQVPSDPQGAVEEALAEICSRSILCQTGGELAEQIVGLIEELCASYPDVCYAQVPPNPDDLVAGLLAYLCSNAPQACQSPPDPGEDPVGNLVATLCTISPVLCQPPPDPNPTDPPPTDPKQIINGLASFLREIAEDPCAPHQYGPVSIDLICADPPPTSLFPSASTAPGTALFGPRVSAGLPTDDATMVQFAYSYSYDASGRQSEITYPSGLRVTNSFDPTNGALTKVMNSSGVAYWEATAWNEWGGVSNATLSNNRMQTELEYEPETGLLSSVLTAGLSGVIQNLGYSWDKAGNLKYRIDGEQDWLREDFEYDELNRVTSATLSNVPGIGSAQNLAITYSANGNISSKSGVGNYVYGAHQPHAVLSAGTAAYAYDANGNAVTGAGRTYTWASYNLPIAISNGAGTSSFLYGPERQRVRQVLTDSTTAKLIYYVGSLYEEHQHGSTIEKKHYISTPAGVVAVETWGTTAKTEYLHRDHLGSVTLVTGSSGEFRQRLAYDAFGKRRGVVSGGTVQAVLEPFLTARGFTGHEHLDNLDLIHMNGRVYEPVLGRFTSADPLVQAPDMTQSHNRYSYVMNNPLSLTDPSGFSWWGKQVNRLGNEVHRWERDFRHEIRRPDSQLGPALQIAGAALSTLCGPASPGCASAVVAATSVAVARAQGVTDVGDLARVAYISAWTAGAFNAAGSAFPTGIKNVIAHGAVGAFSTAANGGGLREGFLAGGFGAAFGVTTGNVFLDTAWSAVVGGTAAKLGGGKFANGAATAAFGYLFNELAHVIEARQRIADTALGMEGDKSYAYSAEKGAFPEETWKCNLFVHDVLLEAGLVAPTTPGGWPIVANDWGKSVPGWKIVDSPMPGDIAVVPRAGESGHVGVYVTNRVGSDVMAANRNGVGWSRSHLYNQYSHRAANASGPTVYQRYIGR